MYDSFYLNMVYPIQRPQLEELASSSVYGNSTQLVHKVRNSNSSILIAVLVNRSVSEFYRTWRQFVRAAQIFTGQSNFILWYIRFLKPFYLQFNLAINDPSIAQEEMEGLIESIANGLFSVCVTLGVVPIIKCPKGNAAEQVAIKLDQKIRDNLRDARNNLFVQENIRAGQWSVHRPVLVLADRNLDLTTMLHHTWTYQAMIHDVMVCFWVRFFHFQYV